MRLPLWAIRWLNRQKLSRRHMRGGKLHSWFGDRILAKELWRPSASSLARAWLVGFPITVTPFLPLQSVFATFAALAAFGVFANGIVTGLLALGAAVFLFLGK